MRLKEISFIEKFSPMLILRWMWPPLDELVACCRIQVEVIELFQIANTGKRLGLEGALAIEGVENDSLEQVSEAHVVVFRQAFQDLYEALLHPHASLNTLNHLRVVRPWYHCTMVQTAIGKKLPEFSPLVADQIKPRH
jgi:hypothetical protein